MLGILSSILLIASITLYGNEAKNFVVFNEKSQVFEITNEKPQSDKIENSWVNLKNYIVGQLDKNEKSEKFSAHFLMLL